MDIVFADPSSNRILSVCMLPTDTKCLLDLCKKQILELLEPERVTFNCFGKQCTMNRDQCVLSLDPNLTYTFSNTEMRSKPMSTDVCELLEMVNLMIAGANFNSILVNRYRDGKDYISAHADNEDGVDPVAGVVTISCGATRKLRIIKKTKTSKEIVAEVAMTDGMLIHMGGSDFQRTFQHEVPREAKVKEERISFTFRRLTY